MFMSLSLASVGGLPKEEIPAGTGIYNLARQMGGSLGVAIITTILAQREAFHQSVLNEHVSMLNPVFVERLNALTGAFLAKSGDPVAAHNQALQTILGSVNMQAALLSFADIFWLVGITFLVTIPLIFLLSKGGTKSAIAAH